MDFFEHQERAKRSTTWLVLYFVFAVVMVIISVYAAAIGILMLIESQQEHRIHSNIWNPQLFATVCASTALIVVLGSLYKIVQIGGSGANVATSLGGSLIPANTRDLGERVLLNVVEEMAIASGTPVPPVYILNNEDGINAFAAGTTPQNAVIGVTRGAVQTLTRDQLQGVIAHEFSHILNGDMRLNIRLMGWLHGILLIALIGYLVLRTVGNSGSRSSSSSSSGKKGDGGLMLALVLSSVALIVIGYVGVFFAQLIKAAVSRQREFLADASAVQFTRNPDGISGALKRIGGWKQRATITAPSAEEASHMFFGSGLTSDLFATHPPLAERIRRIDPTFQGSFPITQTVRHSENEIIDPRSLAASLQAARVGSESGASNFAQAHAAALAGVEKLASQPRQAVEQVGHPNNEHIEQAHGLVDELDPTLASDVRDPLGAVAVIYALLLAGSGTELRKSQLQSLAASADRRAIEELRRVQPMVDALLPEQRLPVACLALPALNQLSPPQVLEFSNSAVTIIRMDNKTTLFEFAIQRFINKRLIQVLRTPAPKKPRVSLDQIASSFSTVLSTLSVVGNPSNREAAFSIGAETLQAGLNWPRQMKFQSVSSIDTSVLNDALDNLENATPEMKRHMLSAFSACISADHRMTVEEGELLRVISDALGCPMPPII